MVFRGYTDVQADAPLLRWTDSTQERTWGDRARTRQPETGGW